MSNDTYNNRIIMSSISLAPHSVFFSLTIFREYCQVHSNYNNRERTRKRKKKKAHTWYNARNASIKMSINLLFSFYSCHICIARFLIRAFPFSFDWKRCWRCFLGLSLMLVLSVSVPITSIECQILQALLEFVCAIFDRFHRMLWPRQVVYHRS